MMGGFMQSIQAVAHVKSTFFDRKIVIDAIGRAAATALSKAGAHIRQTAKRSIRSRKRSSRPGEPPSSHKGTLKDLLYFGFDPRTLSVVVGPTPLGSVGIVPPTLEFGGEVKARRNPRRIVRKIGTGGEIRIGGPPSVTTKRNREGKAVTYCLLRTPDQVARANELQNELYGPLTFSDVMIEPRPYMGPALRENAPDFPAMFAKTVHG